MPQNLKKKQSAKQKSAKDKLKKQANSIKTNPKQATRKSPKEIATPQKNKPKFAVKPQGWERWART